MWKSPGGEPQIQDYLSLFLTAVNEGFKVVQVDGTLSEADVYQERDRICDTGKNLIEPLVEVASKHIDGLLDRLDVSKQVGRSGGVELVIPVSGAEEGVETSPPSLGDVARSREAGRLGEGPLRRGRLLPHDGWSTITAG